MYTFHVPKMSCGGCINTIKNTIIKIDDKAQVDADLATKTINIETSAPEAAIIKAMTDAGYQPTL